MQCSSLGIGEGACDRMQTPQKSETCRGNVFSCMQNYHIAPKHNKFTCIDVGTRSHAPSPPFVRTVHVSTGSLQAKQRRRPHMRRTLQNIAEQMQNICRTFLQNICRTSTSHTTCRTFVEHLQNMGTPGLAGEMQNSDASPFRKLAL